VCGEIYNQIFEFNFLILELMALSAAQMQEAIIKNLQTKTGKTLEQWIVIAKSLNESSNKEVLHKLKNDFGLGHVQAQTIVWRMHGEQPYIDTTGYEEGIFKTEPQLTLYHQIKQLIMGLDSAVQIKPCKTYIPFYAKNQFAVITVKKGEVFLGLNIRSIPTPNLLPAANIGGSTRINKMLKVTESTMSEIKAYVKVAINDNK
jgi:predicted transport protein